MFRVGDRVMVKPGTRYHDGSAHQGGYGRGTIVTVYDSEFEHPYRVLWDNNCSNVYGDGDLIIKGVVREYKSLKKFLDIPRGARLVLAERENKYLYKEGSIVVDASIVTRRQDLFKEVT